MQVYDLVGNIGDWSESIVNYMGSCIPGLVSSFPDNSG
jgi:hypothetical protein